MSKFENLSNEILLKIFDDDSISAEDLISIRHVCRRFNNFTDDDVLWKSKFQKRWPLAWRKIDGGRIKSLSFKKEVEDAFSITKKLDEILSSLGKKLYNFQSITSPVLDSILELFDVGHFGPLVILNQLLEIVRGQRQCDLTTMHYAPKLIEYINYYYLRGEVEEILKLPIERLVLEKAAYYFAKVLNPIDYLDLEYEEISTKLDNLAIEVQSYLKTKNSKHPAVSIKLFSPDESLEDSKYSRDECKEVFECINHILFHQHNFRRYHYLDVNFYLINKVLEREVGKDDILHIIYKAVSHRLGIFLYPLGWDSENLLCLGWKNPNSSEYTLFVKKQEIIGSSGSTWSSLRQFESSAEFLNILAWRALDCVSEIRNGLLIPGAVAKISSVLLFKPFRSYYTWGKQSLGLLLLEKCVINDIHLKHIFESCTDEFRYIFCPSKTMEDLCLRAEVLLATQRNGLNAVKPKHRMDDFHLKYAVGMIVTVGSCLDERYQEFGYLNSPGVIIGWKESSDLEKDFPSYIYKVLITNSNITVKVDEKNITLKKEAVEINHYEIGKYFKKFDGKFYVPNEGLRSEYPDDENFQKNL